MEVGKIDCGAWLTLCPVEEKIGEVKLKFKPMPPNFSPPDSKDVQSWAKIISEFLIDWNLEIDGVAVPCIDENKAQYLGYLFRLEIKAQEEGKEPERAAAQIIPFAANIDNFLGN